MRAADRVEAALKVQMQMQMQMCLEKQETQGSSNNPSGLLTHLMCTKLSDQWCNLIQAVLSKMKDDSRTFCDLDNARGDVEELLL